MLTIFKFLVLTSMMTLFVYSTRAENRDTLLYPSDEAKKSNLVIMDYEDFGPPSMSFELLGQGWWSWESSGSSNINRLYPIKVVVYSNKTLKQIKSQYPVIPIKKQDYRYISLEQANRYLNKNIQDNFISSITAKLKRTKNRLETEIIE